MDPDYLAMLWGENKNLHIKGIYLYIYEEIKKQNKQKKKNSGKANSSLWN